MPILPGRCIRTNAQSAQLLTSDVDERDRPFISGKRTAEGFFHIRPGLGVEYAIARSLAYAPYADLLWWETSEPDLGEAERFADAIHREFPGKILAYNCSPSFNWRKKLVPERLASFQHDIAKMGYRFQFVTLAGFHSLNLAMFELARDYSERGMAAYSELQQAEFAAEADGYTATRHQREVGVGYFDAVAMVISGGRSSTTALAGSTETAQFHEDRPTDRKMVINALNCGANVFMADFEDANTPTLENLIEGQANLVDAVRRAITFDDPQTGRHYALNGETAVLFVRPRGWHLPEKHVL